MQCLSRLNKFFQLILVAVFMGGNAALSQAETKLEVGYIPILPMAQLFVMEGEGWTRQAGLKLHLTRFSDGPAMVQALASGKLDVAYFGIGPAMVARANGIKVKVIAANVVEQVALIAKNEFATHMQKLPAKEAVAQFTAKQGRKPKIATMPKGSVPDAVLRYWLQNVAGIAEQDVEIIGMGAERVQQALLSNAVDAASILEPTLTIVLQKDPNAKVVVKGGQMLPNQPGAIVAVRESLLQTQREAVKTLVSLHKQATDLINADPAKAAMHVQAVIGRGLVAEDLLEKALKSPFSTFRSDPRGIVDATQVMQDFQLKEGTLKRPVALADLFDNSLYMEVMSKQ